LPPPKHILGGQKVYHGKKKKKAGSTKVLLVTTSMCTYNVKIKECQITHIELFILGFLEACDLSKGHLQDTSNSTCQLCGYQVTPYEKVS